MRTSGFDPVLAEIISRRLKIVAVFVVAVIAALVLRLWFLQVVKGPMYRLESENNRIRFQKIPPFRGLIMDRNGELLVNNRPSYNLYITPEDIQNRNHLFKSLKRLISIDADYINDKLKKHSSGYPFKPVLIKKNISREELAVVEANLFNLPGVSIQVRPQRNYIYGKLASHIIGYLGEISEKQLRSGKYPNNSAGDFIGKYGVEGIWHNLLNGVVGSMQVEVDAAGRRIRVISKKPPVPGYNITLTIDKDLQLLAQKLLENKKGAIVALNPNDGEVLAMASSPAFDPNMFVGGIDKQKWQKLITDKDYPMENRAISGQYPPGSVFKIVVALAGLQEGAIDPEEKVLCTGKYRLGNHIYHGWKKWGHGEVDLHKAIKVSCDIYFYKLGKKLGIDTIARYAKMLGLGKKTGIDLSSEEPGLIPTREWKEKKMGVPWQQGETISCAIGQSYVLVTPIQIANLISTVFNGGVIYQPKVVKKVARGNKVEYRFSPKVVSRIKISKKNLDLVKEGLIAVVNEPHGTGYSARIKGITVAGKTGTAQVINDTSNIMRSGDNIPNKFKDDAWFTAIAPAENPKIAVAVLVEHGGHGGSSAGPIAKKIIEQYLKVGQK